MKNELLNRILTSIILLPILLYATILSGVYLIILLSTIYILSFYEIIKNTRNLLYIFFSNILLVLSCYSFYFLSLPKL